MATSKESFYRVGTGSDSAEGWLSVCAWYQCRVTNFLFIFFSNMSYAYIMLFFKEDQFIALKRAELFGITDFIASCGGLLGLFMGVSLLSLVEIIYFCTIRWIYRLKGKTQVPPEANPPPIFIASDHHRMQSLSPTTSPVNGTEDDNQPREFTSSSNGGHNHSAMRCY